MPAVGRTLIETPAPVRRVDSAKGKNGITYCREGCVGLTIKVQGSGFRVQGSGFRDQGSGFRVQGSGFRVQGLGFKV